MIFISTSAFSYIRSVARHAGAVRSETVIGGTGMIVKVVNTNNFC